MKSHRLWIALAILLILAAASMANQAVYHKTTSDLSQKLSQAITAAALGDSASCSRGMQIFEDELHRCLPFFNMTTSHHEVDELASTLARAKSLLEQQNLTEFLVEADQLQTRLKHIDTSEQLLWDNIL